MLSQSGSNAGPKEYGRGDFKESAVFLDLAHAPGETQGYYDETMPVSSDLGIKRRESKTGALPFNRNYQPSLLLFGDWQASSSRAVDGVYDGSRLLNTSLIAAGYRYQASNFGKLELSLVTARLDKGMPVDVKAYYANTEEKRIGYFGNDLGFEADCHYSMFLDHSTALKLSVGLLKPGKAFQTKEGAALQVEHMVEAGLSVTL